MAILSLDDYVASTKQLINMYKTFGRTTIAPTSTQTWFSVFESGGSPSATGLAGSSTTTGTVPVDTDAGYHPITAFAGGATGYLSRVEYGSNVACRIALYDRLWVGGAYAFNANVTGQTPTSFSSRVPNGDYTGLQLWLEQVTAATNNQAVTVSYLDQDNNAASTGSFSTGSAFIAGRCCRIPLTTGDSGIRGVTGVVGATATAGTFNLMILRQLWQGRVHFAHEGGFSDFLGTGLPQIYDNSALYMMVNADSTSAGFPEVNIEIASF